MFFVIQGGGTDDQTLIRVIISRSEIDLAAIREAFEATYGKPLAKVRRAICPCWSLMSASIVIDD